MEKYKLASLSNDVFRIQLACLATPNRTVNYPYSTECKDNWSLSLSPSPPKKKKKKEEKKKEIWIKTIDIASFF